MKACELSEGCIFFNGKMPAVPAMVSMMKSIYCMLDPDKCARLLLVNAIGRDNVPNDLFPHQLEKVEKLIHDPESD